jgi:hypothetical protein
LSADDYGELLETLDSLADSDLVRQIAQAQAQMDAGDWYDEADVRAAMREAGRG